MTRHDAVSLRHLSNLVLFADVWVASLIFHTEMVAINSK